MILDINRLFGQLQNMMIISLPYSNNILDIGSGLCLISSIYPYVDTNFTFTDIKNNDNNNFELAKKYLNSEQYKFIETPSYNLPMLQNRSFNLITMLSVIEHLTTEQQINTLSELKRILSDDGILVISTPNKLGRKIMNRYKDNVGHIEEFSFGELKELIENNGFKIINNYVGLLLIKKINNIIAVDTVIHNSPDYAYYFWIMCKKNET